MQQTNDCSAFIATASALAGAVREGESSCMFFAFISFVV